MTNIFEGARRILWVGHAIAFLLIFGDETVYRYKAWESFASIDVPYFVTENLRDWKPSSQKTCGPDDGSNFQAVWSPKGRKGLATLCFIGHKHRQQGDLFFEINASSRNFQLPADIGSELDRAADARRWRDVAEGYLTAAGWFALWLISATAISFAIGWIVRGFMGIPRGADRKLAER